MGFNHAPRVQARFVCRLSVTFLDPKGAQRLGDGWVVNLSQSGALVYTTIPMSLNETFVLRFACGTINISAPGVVVRIAAKNPREAYFQPYGMRFLAPPAEEQKIKLAVDMLRMKSESKVFDKLTGYWDK